MISVELFAGLIWVEYHQIYVYGDEVPQPGDEAFRHQDNGLCGAGAAGALYLITGLHTGRVSFSVRLEPSEPPLAEHWEDVVDASFTTTSGRITVLEWGGQAAHVMEVPPGTYRVRYAGSGLDSAHSGPALTRRPADSYTLSFWPAPPAPDVIIRQSSEFARHRHYRQTEDGQAPGEIG